MAVASVDSSKATSDELKKQIMEQTSTLEEAPPEPEVVEEEETVEVEGLPEEESKEEPAKEAETPEEKPAEEKKPHRMTVEAEEMSEAQLKKYAQTYMEMRAKARASEREKLKAESEQLKTQTGQQFQLPDAKKINEQFVQSLQEDTFGTMVQFYKTARELEKQQEKAERRADLTFESDKREIPYYREVKPSYDEYREKGFDREHAWDAAERDFLMSYAFREKEKGMQEGSKKIKLQQRAQIAVGEKKGKKEGSLPSPEEAKKMTSAELAKYMKRTKVDW